MDPASAIWHTTARYKQLCRHRWKSSRPYSYTHPERSQSSRNIMSIGATVPVFHVIQSFQGGLVSCCTSWRSTRWSWRTRLLSMHLCDDLLSYVNAWSAWWKCWRWRLFEAVAVHANDGHFTCGCNCRGSVRGTGIHSWGINKLRNVPHLSQL